MLRRTLPRSFANTTNATRSTSSSPPSSSSNDIVLRLVSINDVYKLSNLPKLATFLSTLGSKEDDAPSTTNNNSPSPIDKSIRPSAVCICGDFISPSTLSSIDGGRGHVSTLRAAGITHASLGNHEADVKLEVLRRRISQLGHSALLLNGNVVGWLDDMGGRHHRSATAELDVLTSDDGRIRVGLTGLLSDEPGMFRTPRKFRGLPIESVTKRYDQIRSQLLLSTDATVLVPMTHQSLQRDVELARHMLRRGLGGVILGGHEHEKIYERVYEDDVAGTGNFVDIVKTGKDAERVAVVDLYFDASSKDLRRVEVNFEEMEGRYADDVRVLRIANKHLKKLTDMEDSVVVDVGSQLSSYFTVEEEEGNGNGNRNVIPLLSSERARFQQTTVGSLFCQAIKTELETDVCIINGAPIKASRSYPDGTMSHGQLKEELPFPLKMVVVEMTRGRLREAIEYSRMQIEEGKGGTSSANIPLASNGQPMEVERRGYLQVDFDYIANGDKGSDSKTLLVALPRNLMSGFCKIRPLMELGEELKASGKFPEKDDYIKAIDLIVRFCCKERWASVLDCDISFGDIDTNGDGVLDRNEVRQLLKNMLGNEPDELLLNDMIAAIDTNNDGHISKDEFEEIFTRIKNRG